MSSKSITPEGSEEVYKRVMGQYRSSPNPVVDRKVGVYADLSTYTSISVPCENHEVSILDA